MGAGKAGGGRWVAAAPNWAWLSPGAACGCPRGFPYLVQAEMWEFANPGLFHPSAKDLLGRGRTTTARRTLIRVETMSCK